LESASQIAKLDKITGKDGKDGKARHAKPPKTLLIDDDTVKLHAGVKFSRRAI
jgi:hypothetical protein